MNRAIFEHNRAQRAAAVILERECGTAHKTGERRDLCPKCASAPEAREESPQGKDTQG